ncbi:MAG: nitroreductase family protein [Candidatus Coatesbacteria bacterium]|nr:MAG: nitroreductase family protein [Candidatus Coatesbacteria bacterium]
MVDADGFLRLIKTRRSVRKFEPDTVPREDIEKMLECARFAPSASNTQPWYFVVADDPADVVAMADAVAAAVEKVVAGIDSARGKKELDAYAGYFTFFRDAPAIIAVFMTPYRALLGRLLKRYTPAVGELIGTHASEQSVAAAIENLMLAAHALGYGSVWMTGPLFAKEELEGMFAPPDGYELAALVAVGRPAETPPDELPDRKGLEEIMRYL